MIINAADGTDRTFDDPDDTTLYDADDADEPFDASDATDFINDCLWFANNAYDHTQLTVISVSPGVTINAMPVSDIAIERIMRAPETAEFVLVLKDKPRFRVVVTQVADDH